MLDRFSCVSFLATLWTVGHQAPLSMGSSGREYCSELPFLSPGDCPEPGAEPTSPAAPALAGVVPTTVRLEALEQPQCCACGCLSASQSQPALRSHGLQYSRLPCASSPGVCSDSCTLNRWYHPSLSSSVALFSSSPQHQGIFQ